MRETVMVLKDHQLSEVERQLHLSKLEDIWHECGQVNHTLLGMLSHMEREFAKLPLRLWFTVKNASGEMQELIETHTRRSHAYLMCELVRCATIALRLTMNMNTNVSEHRLETVRQDLNTWKKYSIQYPGPLSKQIEQEFPIAYQLTTKGNGVKNSLLQNVQRASKQQKALFDEVMHSYNDTRTSIQMQLANRDAPVTLQIELNDKGEIAKAYYLAPPQEESIVQPDTMAAG